MSETSGAPSPYPAGAFVVWATVQVREDVVAEFLAGIADDARSSTSDEPGCLGFTVQRDAEDPLRFHLHEVYADRDAFETGHQGAPHYAAWQQVAERTVIETTVTFSQVVDLPADAA